MAFVHLHTHSEYSLLDGANRIPELVSHVKKLGMDSLAVTDHGNLHAAWSFYDEARKQGIRPILGFEAYLAFGPAPGGERVWTLSATGDLREAAANLFALLRAADRSAPTAIAIAPIPAEGLGEAINDRLRRAAGFVG